MKQDVIKLGKCLVSALSLLCVSLATAAVAAGYGSPPADLYVSLARLKNVYPQFVAEFDDKFVFLRDGRKFPISDGRFNKSFVELVEHPDIDDMFYANYRAGVRPAQPDHNYDPGRVRFKPLFDAMYGDCRKGEVLPKLRQIAWLPKYGGGSISVTTINGVDKALEAVSRDLERELSSSLLHYVKPTAGTYNCRSVAGRKSVSMHAYAASLDVNVAYGDYWRWNSTSGNLTWKNRIPVQIVSVFERHGFIWGGYWFHYDTMHFEYRPELLSAMPAR